MSGDLQAQVLALFVGVLSGLIANNLGRIREVYLWMTDRAPIYGMWNHYYMNYDIGRSTSGPRFHHEIMTIKRNLVGIPRVNSLHGKKNAVYTGSAQHRKGHLSLLLRNKEYKENVYEYFPLPNSRKGDGMILVGVALAEDFRGHPAIAAVVLSTVELTKDQYLKIVGEHTLLNSAGRVIVADSKGCDPADIV